jgi:hypothetical protein
MMDTNEKTLAKAEVVFKAGEAIRTPDSHAVNVRGHRPRGTGRADLLAVSERKLWKLWKFWELQSAGVLPVIRSGRMVSLDRRFRAGSLFVQMSSQEIERASPSVG